MDDEVLACGGLIAQLPNKDRIHLIYATDGMKSPAPIIAGRDQISADLGRIRMQESRNAMKLLGIAERNLHFLGLPEAELGQHTQALRNMLQEKLTSIAPQHILVPFRYDRHSDHLAVNHAVVALLADSMLHAALIEYFVYYRWRLMPKRDIRKYIRPQFLYKLNLANVAQLKRRALDCFTSQTTIYYPWMTRPILTAVLLDEECQNPEYFLSAPTSPTGTAVFSGPTLWIRLVHRLEPILLRWKYLVLSMWKRVLQNRG
jgi:LmbE family N-acetylglucosaminyl deacetylase